MLDFTNVLIVLPPGGAITRPLQDVTVAESQTAEFECEVANANTEGKWLKEGQPVDFSENIVSEVKGAVRRLTIFITRPQDVGEYSYQVANSKTMANLRVEGKLLSLSAHVVRDRVIKRCTWFYTNMTHRLGKSSVFHFLYCILWSCSIV